MYGGALYGGTVLDQVADSSLMLDLDGALLSLDNPDAGWVVTKVDVGTPVAREVASDRPNSDGTDDTSALVGGRNIVIGLTLLGADRQTQFDYLAPYLDQRARPLLRIATERGTAYRVAKVRSTGDVSAPWERPGRLDLTLGFRTVDSPYFTGATARTATAWPNPDAPGRAYDLVYDRTYPPTAGWGPGRPTNTGNRPAQWTARIFGPITGPGLTHDETGKAVKFTSGLVVAAGDYLTVDSATRTAVVNGLAGSSRYSFLDFAATNWFELKPGPNTVRLTSLAYSVPAQAEIAWKDTYL